MSFYCFDMSPAQSSAVYNTGNPQLITLMTQGNSYYDSGNVVKAAVYHNYVQESLQTNYNVRLNDSVSQAAYNNNLNIISNNK